MYNPKDIQFVGKHDFDKDSVITGWNKTFSVGIFKWELKYDKRSMKKGKHIVRVNGLTCDPDPVFTEAERIVKLLDAGE